MILRTLVYICSLLCLLSNMNAQANPPLSIYRHNIVNNTLRVDVEQERLKKVVAYINSNFDANIILSPEAMEMLVSVRCESFWMDVLTYICSQNNLEMVYRNDGLLIRIKQLTNSDSSSGNSAKRNRGSD